MNGYIKYSENGGKNMSFLIKNKLGIKFHSKPIYEKKYLKTKVREFDGEVRTIGKGAPKDNMYYTCIACITIDSVMKMNKKNYPQVYLEEFKYKIKKTQTTTFINAELESDSDPEANSEAEPGYNTAH